MPGPMGGPMRRGPSTEKLHQQKNQKILRKQLKS